MVTNPVPSRPALRVRGRSFMALVLAPEAPVTEWLSILDDQVRRSPAFFEGRPVVVDMSALADTGTDFSDLVDSLEKRDIRIIGVEGADASWTDRGVWGRPPLTYTSRTDRYIEVPEKPEILVSPVPDLPSLLLERPIRSGQSVLFEKGDLTIIGSVASGAEVIAGGSIHVYGTLRGRAIAGFAGHPAARIFCGKLDAELLAIDGVYRMADDIGSEFRGRPAQARLDGQSIIITPLD